MFRLFGMVPDEPNPVVSSGRRDMRDNDWVSIKD
jgi:hypothetical protein